MKILAEIYQEIYKILMELWNGVKSMKKTVTLRIDNEMLNKIDSYAELRHMNRTQAIVSMLENTQVIVITEGVDIIKNLTALDVFLKHSHQSDCKKIERICDELWQLLSLITEKIQRQITIETN